MLATYGNDAYKLVLVLHILCAIIGFGTVFFNGIYGAQAKARRGTEALAISQANMLVSRIGEYFIYALFLLGIVLVLLGDPVLDFGQTWIWLAMLLYVAAIGVSHALLWPRVRRMLALTQEMVDAGPPTAGPPPQVAEMERIGRQLAIIDPVLNLTMVAVLFLMVFKPGGPSL